MTKLGRNTGYTFNEVIAHKSQPDFADKQKEAWDMVRESIDRGLPCYGFELELPEFYVINGYDDAGYYHSGPLSKPVTDPKPWQKLGDTGIGILDVYSIRPGEAADDTSTVREALEFAMEHSRNSEKWTFPNYRAGRIGYDTWINTLEAGIADGMGMAANTMVWAECRGFGSRFLREASRRLNGKAGTLLQEASNQYYTVFEHLEKVANLFPFPPGNEINDEERCKKAAAYLRSARDDEEIGLELLGKIVKAL